MTADTTGSDGYLSPELGFDALKDAVALIRCVAAQDGEAMLAITNSTEIPRRLAMMTATVAVVACHRAGLDAEQLGSLLDGISPEVADLLLDQKPPRKGGE